MLYFSLISLIIILLIFAQVYGLGKYVSETYSFFENNYFAQWTIGIILYFGTTFVAFFPFVWISISIPYFVVVFFVKELFVLSFIYLRRGVIFRRFNWIALVVILLSTAILTLFYNIVLEPFIPRVRDGQTSQFQTWVIFKNVIGGITNVSTEFLNNWVFSTIAMSTIFSSIGALMIEYARKYRYLEYLLTFILALGSLVFFNFGLPLDGLIAPYLVLFSLILVVRIITFSRRRYATWYGMLIFAAWSFEPNIFLSLLALSLVTMILYTLLQRPKALLFWTQLFLPLLIVGSLWIYGVSIWLTLVISVIAIIGYGFMLSFSGIIWINKFNNFIIKMRLWIPSAIFALIIILGVVGITTGGVRWQEMLLSRRAFFNFLQPSLALSIIELILYIALVIIYIWLNIYWLVSPKKLVKHRLVILLSSLVILFAYNPIFNALATWLDFDSQFEYLKILAVVPILILGATKAWSVGRKILIGYRG